MRSTALWSPTTDPDGIRYEAVVGQAQSSPLTSVRLRATVAQVRIRNFVHKGLKKLYADDVEKGVPSDAVDKLRKMLAFLDDMEDPEELRALSSWKVH